MFEEDVAKNESDDELEGLAALFLEHERKPAVRIRGYVEEVVANLSDDRFKRNFRLSRDTSRHDGKHLHCKYLTWSHTKP